MADEFTDVQADSSPATPDSTADATSQATTQPATQNGGSQSVPYERFQQVNGRMREYERQVHALTQQIQRLTQDRQQSNQPPTDEERQLREAREALHRVDPSLKELPGQLEQINGVIQGLAQERFVSTGERMIASFAQTHGLDAASLSNTLAGIIQNDPALLARAQKGDVSLVGAYLKGLEPVVAHMKKQGETDARATAAATAQTKTRLTTQVPPRPAGGQSGAAAPKPLTGDFRKDMKALNAEADAMLRGS